MASEGWRSAVRWIRLLRVERSDNEGPLSKNPSTGRQPKMARNRSSGSESVSAFASSVAGNAARMPAMSRVQVA